MNYRSALNNTVDKARSWGEGRGNQHSNSQSHFLEEEPFQLHQGLAARWQGHKNEGDGLGLRQWFADSQTETTASLEENHVNRFQCPLLIFKGSAPETILQWNVYAITVPSKFKCLFANGPQSKLMYQDLGIDRSGQCEPQGMNRNDCMKFGSFQHPYCVNSGWFSLTLCSCFSVCLCPSAPQMFFITSSWCWGSVLCYKRDLGSCSDSLQGHPELWHTAKKNK